MKYIGALVVFILALSLNLKSVAEEASAVDSATIDSATCSKESPDCLKTEKVENKSSEMKHEGHEAGAEHAEKDWSHLRHEQISAIFPQKMKNPAVVVRPDKVKLSSPKFLSKISGNTAKLEWTAAQGAKTYHVQVSPDAGFNNRSVYVLDNKEVAGTSVEVTNLEPGKKYFWRVAAVNEDQASMYTKSVFVSSAFETEAK